MATTLPIPSGNTAQKPAPDSVESQRKDGVKIKKSSQPTNTPPSKSVNLDVLRKDIAKVEVADTDFVLTTKSGRKILIRDGALNAVTDEEFSVVFSDEESVAAKVLFNESQSTAIDAAPLNWSDASEAAALVVPATVVASGISYTTLGAAAALAAAVAGRSGGKEASPPDNAALAKAALQAISKFANDNTESKPTATGKYIGTEPTADTYDTAGVKGVDRLNVGAINDSLATAYVTGESVNSLAKLQALVTAYNTILALAENGEPNLELVRPTAEQYTLIGLKGLEPVDATNKQAVAINAAKVKLLGDVIDRKNLQDVDTIKEIQSLFNSVSAVIEAVNGGALTKTQLDSLGLKGVLDTNIAMILGAIDRTKDDGTEVDEFIELQKIIDTINGGSEARRALDIIIKYAQNNGNGESAPPDVGTYIAAGVTSPNGAKVSEIEKEAFNDALRTDFVKGESVDTLDKVQALVNAYRKVFALAVDDLSNTAHDALNVLLNEYERIGADIAQLKISPLRLKLLNDIVHGQNFEGVNTIKEINRLIEIANAIQDKATGVPADHALTVDDFKLIKIRGIAEKNLGLLLSAIEKAGAEGEAKAANADSVSELQNLLFKSLVDDFTFDAIQTDSGFSSRDFITKDKLLTFSGKSKALEGTRISITLHKEGSNQDLVFEGKVDSAGNWLAGNGAPLEDGKYKLILQMYDGQQPEALLFKNAFDQPIEIDSQYDSQLDSEQIEITAIESKDGGIDYDFITTQTKLKYVGSSTAANGTKVAVEVDGVLYFGAVVLNNEWRLDNTGNTLSLNRHTVKAYLVDEAGNYNPQKFTQQTVEIQSSEISLVDKTENAISVTSNLELTFSVAVKAVAGKIIRIFDTTNPSVFEEIDAGSSKVTIDPLNDHKVIIKPSGTFIRDHTYKATIDSGAFETEAGVAFAGLLGNQWTFRAVDPSTTVSFVGLGPQPFETADGINAEELGVNASNLFVKGEISSPQLADVSSARITKITFTTNSNTPTSFNLDVLDPVGGNVKGVTWSSDGKTWTLANDVSWASKLISGEKYTVKVDLGAKIGAKQFDSVGTFQSAAVLIDKDPPALISVNCDLQTLSKGGVAKFDIVFSEDPVDSFTEADLEIAQFNGNDVARILSITGGGKTRTVVLQANDNVSFNSATDNTSIFKIKPGSFKDAVGNISQSVSSSFNYPPLTIDTLGPFVSDVKISGILIKENGTESFSATLGEGDKIRVKVTMSEDVLVTGVPTFTLVVGNAKPQAKYVSGSGSKVLVFEYTVGINDKDISGGVTAEANSLSFGTGRITDNLYNMAQTVDPVQNVVKTPPIVANTNGLVIDAGANGSALAKIKKFADDNTKPFEADYIGTEPTVDDYKSAGVDVVNEKNYKSINNALATSTVTGASINDLNALKQLVSAYIRILDLADSNDNNSTPNNPEALQYTLIGVQGVDSNVASLLGDVIDVIDKTDVATVPQIQDRANAAKAVMLLTRNITGLTRDQLTNQLKIVGVTIDNFSAVSLAIMDATGNEDAVNTWQELQDLVKNAADKAKQAFDALIKFANDNADSLPVSSSNGQYNGVKPSPEIYKAAGIAGEPDVSDESWVTLANDALATAPIKGDNIETFDKLQTLVTAAIGIVKLANNNGDTKLTSLPLAAAYKSLGVDLFQDGGPTLVDPKAQLLSDIIDRKNFQDVNTIKKIQALAQATSAVIDKAAGIGSVTTDHLKLLGFNVADSIINKINTAIDNTLNDGTEVDSYIELSKLIADNLGAAEKAIMQIANFADQNSKSKPTPLADFKYNTSNDIDEPTIDTYKTAGVRGFNGDVTQAEAEAFNDALATANVVFTSVNTQEKIQKLADAYIAVLNIANGIDADTSSKPTLEQYDLLGVADLDVVTQIADAAVNTAVVQSRVSLLGDVIAHKTKADVDTVLEIQNFANIASRVMYQANGLDGLSVDDLNKLGVDIVTADNFAVVRKAIVNTPDTGDNVDTIQELQNLLKPVVEKFNKALDKIKQYADTREDPTNLGAASEQPTVQDYLDLGIDTVKDSNLASMNSALATKSVKSVQVSDAKSVRELVNAYLEVLAAANKNQGDVIEEKDYTLLGVVGIVGDKYKVNLLNDVIDYKKEKSEIDTADELQTLADIVNAVMNTAASRSGGLTSIEQFKALGVTGVIPANLGKVLSAIEVTPNDGSEVDTVFKIQKLVNQELGLQATALAAIAKFAGDNSQSKPLNSSNFQYQGDRPTRLIYLAAGIQGDVTEADADSFNDALATLSVNAASVINPNDPNDASKLQKLVNAYHKFFALADADVANVLTATQNALTADDCNLLGISPVPTGVSNGPRLQLLTDIVDRQKRVDVATIAQINRLATITNAIQDQADGKTLNQELTDEDFALIGVKGVTSTNLRAFLTAIEATEADNANSVPELQSLLFNTLSVNFTGINPDTGAIDNDFITKSRSLTFSGESNAADNTKIKLILKREGQSDITIDGGVVRNGQWSIADGRQLDEGSYRVTAKLQLADGTFVPKDYSFDKPVVIDFSSDDRTGKTIEITEISPDSGTQDFRTSATNLIFKGKATAAEGSYVALTLDGELKYSSVVGADGFWSVDFRSKTLSKGDYKVIASLTDAAGNPIISSKEETITIDTAVKLTLTGSTKGVITNNTPLQLFFDAPVVAKPNKYINLVDESQGGKTIQILTTDSQVSISGSAVTLNLSPQNALVANRNYHFTIDEGAFVSTTDATFDGVFDKENWRFTTVGLTTSIILGGENVNASDGINGSELNALIISGLVESKSWGLLSNSKVSRLTFTSTDLILPDIFTVTTNLSINPDGTWSVGNGVIGTDKFVSGKRYTVQATLTSSLNNTDFTSVVDNNTPVLVDKVGPKLTITKAANLTRLALGQSSTFTFEFDEAPVGFTVDDIAVGTVIVNGQSIALGSLSDFKKINDTKFTVVFTANMPDIQLNNAGLFSVAKGNYKDAVGNDGIATQNSPTVELDTRATKIANISISGFDVNDNAKPTTLGEGDKIKITLRMSEVTELIAIGSQTPGFKIDIGGMTRTAFFVASSNNTDALQFEYLIGPGDNDSAGGITATKDSLVNVAILRDTFGNSTNPSTDVVQVNSNNITVDTRKATAIKLISSFAQENVTSSDKQNPIEFTYKVDQSGRKPILQDYTDANVTDVTDKNIDAINDALATVGVGLANTNSTSGIQKVVSAYNAAFALANATIVNGAKTNPVDTPAVPAVRVSQFADIGADIGGMTDGSINLRLLNSVLDFKFSTEIDTVKEINLLAAVTNAILDKTNNGNAASAALLTKENLINLGLGTLDSASAGDIAGVLESIAAQRDGTNIDTQGKLQSLVNFYMLQPLPSIGLKTDSGINAIDLKSNDSFLNFTKAVSTAAGTSIVVSLEESGTYGSVDVYNNSLRPQTSGTYTVWARLVNDQGFLGRRQSFTFTLDVNGPQAIKLNTNATNSNTEDVAYGGTSFGQSKLIASNIQAVNDDDIAVITLKISNFSAATDKVTYRSSGTFSALTLVDGQTQSVTIDGVPIGVNVKYTASSNIFEFSTNTARTSRVFTALEVQSIERALGFSTTDKNGNARKFEFNHTDVAGNSNAATGAATVTMNIDNQSPNKVLFVSDLGERQVETGFYNKLANSAGLAVAIAANIKPTTDTDIAKIQLTIGVNDANAAADSVLFGGDTNNAVTLNLATSGRGSGVTIGGVSGVDWEYIVNGTSRTLTFSLTNKAAFRSVDVAILESNLFFKSGSLPNIDTQADRTFTFDHIDMVGLSTQTSSSGATKTIRVDYNATKAVDLIGNNGEVIDAAALQYFGKAIANGSAKAVTIAPTMALPVDNDIASFSVALSGVGFDFVNDKIFINDSNTLFSDLNIGDTGGVNSRVAGVIGITWTYIALDKSFIFKRANGLNFDAADVQKIEQALIFKTLSNNQGERAFKFTHFDQAGNASTSATATIKLDTLGPGDIDLDGNKDGANAETSQYFNQSVLLSSTKSVLIAGNIAKPVDNDIASISVTVGGINFDPTSDKFVINGVAYALNADLPATTQTIAGVSGVTFSYANKTLTFKKSNGDSFDVADVQKIEGTLGFQTNGTSQGDRSFTFIHTDQAGNTSNSATATIQVDTLAPGPIDLDDNGIARRMNIAALSAGVFVADRIKQASSNEGVVSIQVNAKGSAVISAEDRLLFGSVSVAIGTSTDLSNGTQPLTIGNVDGGVNWFYSGAAKTLTFRKANNTAFLATEAQAVERALLFQTSANARAGDRKFEFTHTDAADNTSLPATVTFATDVKAPIVSWSSSSANVRVIDTNPTTATSLAAAGANVSEEDRIASFQIKVRGLRAGNAERIVIGDTEIDASGGVRASVSDVTVAGSTWRWNYNAALGVFVFTATRVERGVTPDQAAAFLSSLAYKATTSTPGDDVRQFSITATDAVGNTSANEAVSSVVLSATAPAKHLTNSSAVLDGNDADRFIGDVVVMTFTEPVKVSLLLNISAWTISGGNSWGVGANVSAVDSVTVNGEAYATNFRVTTGVGANIFLGQAKTATFAGSTGGVDNYASKAAIILPTFTLTSPLPQTNPEITLEAWIFPTAPNQSFQRIFDFGTQTAINPAAPGSSGTSIWLGTSGSSKRLAFEFLDTQVGASAKGTVGTVVSTAELVANTWQHVAVTYSGTTATLYINGSVAASTLPNGSFSKPLPNSITFNNNFIGKSNWMADAGFYGSIFDARVYTIARTGAEIFNDYKGWLDTADARLLFQYDLNNDTKNGATTPNSQLVGASVGAGVSRDATMTSSGVTLTTAVVTTVTVKPSDVMDAASINASGDQVFQLYKTAPTIGGLGSDSIPGTVGNDFIAGQGGNDSLTGGAGADTFAWFLGETGNDTVNDFKVSEGDMVDLSGLLSLVRVGPPENRQPLGLNNVGEWGKYLRLSISGDNMVLSIDLTGGGFATTTSKTITFTNGALNGLNDNIPINGFSDTLPILVSKRIINLTAVSETPLMFDLNGDGVRTLSVSNGVAFGVQGQGSGLVKSGWSDGKDGLLVLDLNNDGKINGGSELFGGSTKLANGSKAQDGYEALKQYDSNQDNVIDAKDAVFSKLQLWVDANLDGVTDNGELRSLSEFKVQSINLSADSSSTLDNGNLLGLVSKWTDTNGQAHQLADVWFNTTPLTPLEKMVADGQKVDLTAPGQTSYDLRLNDVLSTTSKTVVITADNNDVVQIDYTGWINTGSSASINNHVYNHWENGNAHLMIDQMARVQAVL